MTLGRRGVREMPKEKGDECKTTLMSESFRPPQPFSVSTCWTRQSSDAWGSASSTNRARSVPATPVNALHPRHSLRTAHGHRHIV